MDVFTLSIFLLISLFLGASAAQQQYFRVQPHDVKVQEGGEAMLECEVANLVGQVQWTKDGFALGFSSVIPGFPRYSVIGDRRHGVYNLRISNASLEDDAEYQCQVGPAKLNKAIRANARLNVTSPPSSVEILDHRHNSKIEIKENQEFHLECRVRNAKPAAKIVWYRGNVEINIPSREDQTIEIPGKNGDKRVTRYDTHSRISLKPTAEDDYAEYTCEARHEALSPDIPMRATVQLSVLYPPGLPYIEGYTEGETIKRGQTVELVCRSRGGNPPAQLIWYKNGEQIRMAYRTAGRVSENVYTFTADASDNKARYKCEASNIMSKSPLKAELDMTVLFSPSHVTISGPTEARVGDPVPLTCTTANSNPPAEIKWMVAGRQVRNATSRTVVSPEGGWITTSNITAVVEPNRRSLVVICHGLNMQLTENVVSTHTINVLYPPSQPFVHGYVEGTHVPAGTVQKISCTSSGGNPLATLTWYKNDKKIHSTVKTTDKSVTAEITILTNVTDNEARYRCEAANSATEIPLFETITMSVYFPPETVRIRQEPPELKPNEEATLICDSSSSNPPAKLSWWREGIPVHGVQNYSKPGLHGGTVSSIELKVNVSEDMNGIQYACQAQNEALQRSTHDSVTLQVLYKPVFDKNNEDSITGIENEPLIISLKADGNPNNIAYTWTKDGLPITQASSSNGMERILSDGPTLNITRLSRHDAGTYSCEALNSQGSNLATVNVTVQYSATITQTSETVIVNPKEDATLSCTVDSNPIADDTITWKRDDFPDFDARTSVMYDKNGTSYLRITQVTREDLGHFQCIANNGVGNITTREVMLIVKHKPEIDEQPAFLKFASDAGDTGKLTCRSQASPLARYTWARNGNPISANTTGKYYTTYRQVDQLTSESVLYISHVTSADYGSYECVARNELGFSTISPRLEVTSSPDTPTLLIVLNATHDSVTLGWTPGFDGGMKPTYRIRYRQINEDGYKYEDVTGNNATTYTVKGLSIDTQYIFSIMASNKLGSSKYMPDLLSAKTSNKIPPSYSSPSLDERNLKNFPGFLIIVGTIVGTLLILMNVLLIGCCLHRRSKKRPTEQNNQTSKSATIEMYAPSSYNDTMTGETLSSVSEKSETYSNEGSNNEYVDDSRSKQAPNSYLIEQPPPVDYPPGAYPVYEMQMGSMSMAHKTHTLPHPHHHHHHMHDTRPRSRDDQSLGQYGPGTGMSAKSSYVSAPTPTPPADGSYYNVSDRYLSYPPPLDFQNPPPVPAHPHLAHTVTPATPPLPSNGSLLRHQRHVPPPDVLHNTSQNAQILQAQTLTQKREMSSFGNGYGVNEQEGHLV
ncbi:nephrin adhesion molecule sticks and stones isoform X2 [Rhynchophorus ferrugineus]|uniref:nephrin adhesion molecule sticks and stones isoform X2 n=1 Tax=Rhynchophorus ferrugineus TaxID=354439 RepID=UPI003FCE398E